MCGLQASYPLVSSDKTTGCKQPYTMSYLHMNGEPAACSKGCVLVTLQHSLARSRLPQLYQPGNAPSGGEVHTVRKVGGRVGVEVGAARGEGALGTTCDNGPAHSKYCKETCSSLVVLPSLYNTHLLHTAGAAATSIATLPCTHALVLLSQRVMVGIQLRGIEPHSV